MKIEQITGSAQSIHHTKKTQAPTASFSAMLDQLKTDQTTVKAFTNTGIIAAGGVDQNIPDSRLPGDYLRSMHTNANPTDTVSPPQGQARDARYEKKTVDKTSPLYEQALELESFFVKIMINSMRASLDNSNLAGNQSFASKMYQDMMYDEMSRSVTKNAGFGLADQIYLQN